jgi:hypothetical protein
MLERIQVWYNTDPQAKRKLIFWVVAIFVILLIIGVAAINTLRPKTNPPSNTSSTQFTAEVTANSFESAKNLEKVSNAKVGMPDKIFFIPGGKIGFFNESFKLLIDGQDISLSPSFFPNQVYYSPEGLIINSDTFSTFYLNSGQFKNFNSDILQITPFQIPDDLGIDSLPGYIFLSKNQDKYTIKQSSSSDLTKDLKSITTFTLSDPFRYAELRILNGSIYLFTSENSSAEGAISISKLTGNTLQEVQTLNNVRSMIFSDKKVLYTIQSNKLPEVTNYENLVLDFSKNPNGDNKSLDIATTLVQNNLNGSIFAKRCTFDLSNSLYCLVKEQKVNFNNFQFKDSLVKINLTNDEISYPIAGLVFSASNVIISNNGTIYLVGQENNILYRVKL